MNRVTSPSDELSPWEQLALEVAQVGTWEWNFTAGQGRWSAQLCLLLGIGPDEIALGPDGVLPFVQQPDKARYQASIFAALEGRSDHSLEYRIVRPDGRVRWVFDRAKVLRDLAGEPVRMLGAIVDVTDSKHEEFGRREIQRAASARRRAEKALLETEYRLTSILDNAPAAVYVKDLNGKLTFVNRRFLEIFRLTRAEVLKDGVAPHHPPDILLNIQQHDRAVLQAGQALQFEEEIEVFGERRSYLSVKFPLIDAEGQPYALCGISADVTDRKVTQQAIQDRTLELQNAIEDLNQLTYLVSHDMRSPVRGIISNARFLREELGDALGDVGYDKLERIEASALKLGQLVDDLLAFVRIGRTELLPERVDVSQMASLVVGRLRSRPECRDANVTVEPDIEVVADRDAIATILDALVHNACRYALPGHLPNVRIGQIPNGFCVEDSGIGIDMQYAHKIFMPLERLHRDEEYLGTGIGLAKVKRLVERQGGRVWVESDPGRGAKFSVQFGA